MRALAGMLLALLGLPVGADQVCLASGRCLEGRIIEQTPTRVVVDVGAGRVGLPRDQVLSIRSSASALDTFEERAARLEPGDAAGWLELGFWARDRQLETRARAAFERVLRLDPGNATAQQALPVERAAPQPSPDPSPELERQWRTLAERTADLEQRAAGLEQEQRDAERRSQASASRPAAREHWGWDEGDTFVSGVPGISGPIRVPAGQFLPGCQVCPTCPHPNGRHEHGHQRQPAAGAPPDPAQPARRRTAGWR